MGALGAAIADGKISEEDFADLKGLCLRAKSDSVYYECVRCVAPAIPYCWFMSAIFGTPWDSNSAASLDPLDQSELYHSCRVIDPIGENHTVDERYFPVSPVRILHAVVAGRWNAAANFCDRCPCVCSTSL